MTTPKRIQMSRQHPWKHLITNPNGHVICDRRGKWGNPFKVVGQWGGYFVMNATKPFRFLSGNAAYERATLVAIEAYGDCIGQRIADNGEYLTPLHGRDLCCWCRLCDAHKDGRPLNIDCQDCDPCHVDILGKLANPELFEVKE